MRRWALIGGFVALSGLVACSSKTTPGNTSSDTGTSVSKDTMVDVPDGSPDVSVDATADTSPVDTFVPPVDVDLSDTQVDPLDTFEEDTFDTGVDTFVEDTWVEDVSAEDVFMEDLSPQDTAPEPVEVTIEEGESIDLFPPPPGPTPRSRRRMNLDQIQASIVKLTGISDWVASNANLFEEYATPLGRPDFESSVLEDLEPGLLFEKVLGDFVRYICPLVVESDAESSPEERVFITEAGLTDTFDSAPDLIEKNLQSLLLQYHANYIPFGSPEFEPWLTLFDVGTNDGDEAKPLDGWTLVCSGLLSHPNFYSY